MSHNTLAPTPAKSKATKSATCEVCALVKRMGRDTTVCAPCEDIIEKEHEQRLAARATKWLVSHSCRGCGRGLPLGRYFECEACNPESLREGETEWDAVPAMDFDEEKPAPTASPLIAQPLKKVCKGVCGRELLLDEYSHEARNKDGKRTQCRKCRALVYDDYLRKKNERTAPVATQEEHVRAD